MKNFYFVANEKNNTFELWVNGECITDCFSLNEESFDLMEDLVNFADVPLYKEMPVIDLKKE